MVVVRAAYDAEAGVWFVESSDLFGLNLEASTLEGLRASRPGRCLTSFEANGEAGELDVV